MDGVVKDSFALGGVIVALTATLTAAAAEPADRVLFSRDIAPLLVQKCQGCHGHQKQKGGYRLDTFDHLARPGDSEAAPLLPGRPEASELFRLISLPDEHARMPQKDDPLPKEQVTRIEKWIREGAEFDGPDRAAPLQMLMEVSHPPAPATYSRPVPAVALAFAPGGAALAVGGYHEVTVWEVPAGRLLRRVGNVAQRTYALAYSTDGQFLAVAGGTPGALGEVRLFTTETFANPRVLDRIGDVMLTLCFSPDGKRLAAGGADGAVRVYDVATGNRTMLIEPHADWVTAIAFSPDGGKIASASRDKSARVFDAATGELLSAYLGHEEPLFALAWSPDGKTLYTGGRDREIHAWEPSVEAKKVREMKGFTGDILRLAVLGDHLYSTSADGKLRQHRRDNGGLVYATEIGGDWLPGLAVHRAGGLAAGAFDGTVRIVNPKTGKACGTFRASPETPG